MFPRLFLDINHETLLIGMVMPIVVAMILALLGGFISYQKLTRKNGTPPYIGVELFVSRLLAALEASTAALDKVAQALTLLQQHSEETRTDHSKQTEALTKLLERIK